MFEIKAFKLNSNSAIIKQSEARRDWMEETYEKHAYQCFPLSLTNTLGWSVSFPEEISFVWNGISNSIPDNVKILSGNDYVHTRRANATISFKTNTIFKTQKNITILIMPTPNLFIRGVQCFTTLISTSFFESPIDAVWKILEPNVKITIPAGTPVCNIIPISLSEMQDSKIIYQNKKEFEKIVNKNNNPEKEKKIRDEIYLSGNFTKFYKNGTNAFGEKIGEHEVKKINFEVENA